MNHVFDRIDLVAVRVMAVRHDGILVDAMGERNDLGQFLEEVDDRSAAEAERDRAIFERFLQPRRDLLREHGGLLGDELLDARADRAELLELVNALR